MRAGRILLIASVVLLIPIIGVMSYRQADQPTFYLCAAAKKAWIPILEKFEKLYHVKVRVIYGSSGGLLNQMVLSKVGDIYSSATPPYMEKAEKMGVVYPDTVRVVACLKPAILTRKGLNVTLQDILFNKKLKVAMCDPQSCAVGKYFKMVFERMGIWDKVKDRIYVYTENFAKLVNLLYLGEVDAAFGWHIAKYWYPNKIDYTPVKANLPYKPCIMIAVSKYSKHKDIAQKFIEFLNSDFAKYIFFEKYHYAKPGELG